MNLKFCTWQKKKINGLRGEKDIFGYVKTKHVYFLQRRKLLENKNLSEQGRCLARGAAGPGMVGAVGGQAGRFQAFPQFWRMETVRRDNILQEARGLSN